MAPINPLVNAAAGTGRRKRQREETDTFSPILLAIHPTSQFSAESGTISQPTEVACASRDAKHVWHFGSRSGLRILRQLTPPVDLNKGFSHFLSGFVPNLPDNLDVVLQAVAEQRKAGLRLRRPQIVTWRGNLTKIACAPWTEGTEASFEMGVWRMRGILFLTARRTAADQQREAQLTVEQKRYMWYGYAFERAAAPGGILGSETHELESCFCSVFKTRIGGCSLLAGAEVDAETVSASVPGAPLNANYAELKVSQQPRNPRDRSIFCSRKLPRWYYQSFFSGCPKIVHGLRDVDGILREVKEYNTLDLPRLAAQQNRVGEKPRANAGVPWDAGAGVRFLSAVLHWLLKFAPADGVCVLRRVGRTLRLEREEAPEGRAGPTERFEASVVDACDFAPAQ